MRTSAVYAISVLVLLAICPSLLAHPVMAFDTKFLLNSADLVCHAKVISVGPHEVEKDPQFHPPLETEGSIAKATVINVIKGERLSSIDVVFRKPTITVFYTQLRQGEEAILFLKKEREYYRFVDDHNGTLQIPPHKALRYSSESPENRMIAELIFATESDSGAIRLQCTEQLGKFANSDVILHLKQLAENEDMALKGTAYTSLIELDQPPEVEELTAFFARQ
ncbi:MAG: hypothetical protein ABIH23_18700, partial [bacterium]